MNAAARQAEPESNPIIAYGQWLAQAPKDWPPAALATAQRAFIDTIGVAIPGAAQPAARTVIALAAKWGAGPCTAIGSPVQLSAPWAALANGTAAHALDFDDNFDPAKAHASAVLIPAILALAEQEGASGLACLDAYIAGLQIMARVGQGVNPAHRNRGWHATATVGTLGAAAACARLLHLPPEQASHALSISTSMAGGFMSQFGTATKPIHAGLAAKAGVISAELARAGIDAGADTLDGPNGMNQLMVGPDLTELRARLTRVDHGQTLYFETEQVGAPLMILSSGLKVKRFPNCGSAHRAMDAFQALQDRHGFAAKDIAAIRVSAPVVHLNNLMYRDPVDPAQARFSLEYALACLAVRRRCSLVDFTPEAVRDPAVRSLFPIVQRDPVDKSEGEFPTRVEVLLHGGTVLAEAVAMPVGSLAAPISDAQLWDKFAQCTASMLSDAELAALRCALDGLTAADPIDRMMGLLAKSSAGETRQ